MQLNSFLQMAALMVTLKILKLGKAPGRALTEPEELKKYIIKMNVKQYNQAVKTPFGQEPLASLFGADGTTEFDLSFLRKEPLQEIIVNQLQPETVRLLEVLQKPPPKIYQGEMGVTPAQYISCYK